VQQRRGHFVKQKKSALFQHQSHVSYSVHMTILGLDVFFDM